MPHRYFVLKRYSTAILRLACIPALPVLIIATLFALVALAVISTIATFLFADAQDFADAASDTHRI